MACLAISGMPALAQEESLTVASPVIVTGTEVCGNRTGGTSTYVGGVNSDRGWVSTFDGIIYEGPAPTIFAMQSEPSK